MKSHLAEHLGLEPSIEIRKLEADLRGSRLGIEERVDVGHLALE